MSAQDTTESPDSAEEKPPSSYKKQTAFRLAAPVITGSETKPPVSDGGGLREVQNPGGNPFSLPADNIFLLRNQQTQDKKLDRQRQRLLKVHEKVTYAGRLSGRQAELRRELARGQDEGEDEGEGSATLSNDPTWRTAAIQEHNDSENISEYIGKKREMFRIEYSLAVQREVIQKLAEVAEGEEKRLQQAEKFLEEDAAMFDDFLKENDKNSVQAIKIAEQETKNKLDKVAEMKRLMGRIVAAKSDISKNDEILKEYTTYDHFLLKLSPPEWQEQQRIRRETAERIRAAAREQQLAVQAAELEQAARTTQPTKRHASQLPPITDTRSPRRQNALATKENIKPKEVPKPEVLIKGKLSDYEDPQLYFTEPQQLLDLLAELEEQNLNLIQNSSDTEEALEEFSLTMEHTRRKMGQETEQLTQQIDIITHAIQRERDHAAELELKARLFSFGKYRAGDQDVMLERLGRKVEVVYRSCVGETEGSLSTLQMLTNIENRLGELLEDIELVPRDRVLMAERARKKERRIRQREEKVRLQKLQQEERLRKALERAQADIKRPTGRKLMPRSQPPLPEKEENYDADLADLEIETYFFT